MTAVSPKVLQLSAAGMLLGGGVMAQVLFQQPITLDGSDPARVRELAHRVEAQQAMGGAGPLTPPEGASTAVPSPVLPPPTAPTRPIAGVRRPSPSPPQALTRPVPPRVEKSVTVPAPPEDPTKHVALMGITHANGEVSAWLVDLRDQQREIVGVGDRAFGLTLKEIDPESVVLTRGDEEFELRLGQKQIASASGGGSTYTAASGDEDQGPGGLEGERRGRRGGFPGFGGEGFSGRLSRSGGFPSFGGGFSGRGSRSGGDRSSRYSGSSAGSSSDSSGSSRYGSGSSGSGRSGSSSGGYGRSSSGGYGRSSGSGGSGFAGNSGGNSASQFSSAGAVGSTSNPQTARRNGARLSGDSAPVEAPAPITNPQTTRRMGSTGSTGAAFGQDSGTVGSRRFTNGGRQGR